MSNLPPRESTKTFGTGTIVGLLPVRHSVELAVNSILLISRTERTLQLPPDSSREDFAQTELRGRAAGLKPFASIAAFFHSGIISEVEHLLHRKKGYCVPFERVYVR